MNLSNRKVLWADYCPPDCRPDAVKFLETVRKLSHIAVERDVGISPAAGLPGIVRFLSELQTIHYEKQTNIVIEKACDLVIRRLSDLPLIGLYQGQIGAIMFLDQVREMRDCGIILGSYKNLDIMVEDYMSRFVGKSLDLVNGLIGIGVYALARQKTGPNIKIGRLTIEKLTKEVKAYRLNPSLSAHNSGLFYDYGLAHGVPGLIVFLVHYGYLVVPDDTSSIVRALAYSLLYAEGCGGEARYSCRAGEVTPSRLGWCYGDLSVAFALAVAGRHVNDPDLSEAAVRIIGHAATRSWGGSLVEDAGLCHGAIGIAHLFQRSYVMTSSLPAKMAAKWWLSRFFESYAQDPTAWFRGPGFLEGTAGGGLAVISSLVPSNPRWDSAILLL